MWTVVNDPLYRQVKTAQQQVLWFAKTLRKLDSPTKQGKHLLDLLEEYGTTSSIDIKSEKTSVQQKKAIKIHCKSLKIYYLKKIKQNCNINKPKYNI